MMENLHHPLSLLLLLLSSCLAQEQEDRNGQLRTAWKEMNADLRELQVMKILMIGKRSPLDQEFEDHWPGERFRMLKRKEEAEEDQRYQKQEPERGQNLFKRVRGPGGGPAWYAMLK